MQLLRNKSYYNQIRKTLIYMSKEMDKGGKLAKSHTKLRPGEFNVRPSGQLKVLYD